VTDVEYQGSYVLLGVAAQDGQGATALSVMLPEARFAEQPLARGQAVQLWWRPEQGHAAGLSPARSDFPRSPFLSSCHLPGALTMSDTPSTTSTAVQRRALLKGTAGILAAGVFPAVHAQEKIVLRYLGTAVNQDKAIAEKFKADTGITIQYVAVTTDDVTKRAVTAPNSFDLIDTEYFSLKKIVPTGNLKGIDTSASRTPTRSPRCSPPAWWPARRWATRARRPRR
jgi:hypothetical protein